MTNKKEISKIYKEKFNKFNKFNRAYFEKDRPIASDHEFDELKKELISSKTKIIAVTHLSNVTGTIVPVKEIIDIAHNKNIPVSKFDQQNHYLVCMSLQE